MPPETSAASESRTETLLRTTLGGMSVFTMLMTIPQVLTIWVGRQATGVSVFSWGAYLASAVLWLWFGLKKGEKNLYLPCIGWIVLDAAVVAGVLVYG